MGGTSHDSHTCSLKLTICLPLSYSANLGGSTLPLWRLTSPSSSDVELTMGLTNLLFSPKDYLMRFFMYDNSKSKYRRLL